MTPKTENNQNAKILKRLDNVLPKTFDAELFICSYSDR